jgi:hypothetical protein
MDKFAQATGASLAWVAAGLAAATLGGCGPQQPKTPSPVIPPRAQSAIVPGSAAVTVPARTGSMSSGTLGSSTVVGAPPPDQAGIALAH